MPIAAGSLLVHPTTGKLMTANNGKLLTANGTSDHCCCGCDSPCANCSGPDCTPLCMTVSFSGISFACTCVNCRPCIITGNPNSMHMPSGSISASFVFQHFCAGAFS